MGISASGASDDAHLLRERRFIGSLLLRLQEDTSQRPSWEQSASGERIVGARLDRIAGIEVLHDRRVPGSRAIIDHIAIGAGGAYVIDSKLYGAMTHRRDANAFARGDQRFVMSERDQMKLVAKMGSQVSAITRALVETPIRVTAGLCFVDAQWPSPARPFMLNGVWIGWPDALGELVTQPGFLDAEAITATARLLDLRLPRA